MAVHIKRRRILQGATILGAAAIAPTGLLNVLAQNTAPGVITRDAMRPQFPSGVMTGDVTAGSCMVWSRTDRPARMTVEYGMDEALRNPTRLVGPAAMESSDFTARMDLRNLPPNQLVHYRVRFQDLTDPKVWSEPMAGRFRTPPATKRTIRFAFSGDEAGQGWGINEAWGGYRTYAAMRKFEPDFFIHSGDQIYADGPIQAEARLEDGTIWKNITTEAKSKVAETLDEFRGNYAYNLLDVNKRRFAAEVPFLVQWDDHETRNNWYPEQILGDARYKVKSASLLAARAKQAMFEYNPMRIDAHDPERIYRAFDFGPSLEVMMLDERSYRGPNTPNVQEKASDESAFLGRAQMAWLKAKLKASKATWKAIASDMPLSLVVPDGNLDVPKGTFEAWANGDDGAPKGRELEVAELLAFIKANRIRNVVWFTADVHYAQATRFDPSRAQFQDFDPFWEFVAGSINAGTFGPAALDKTFGPDLKFVSVPPGNKQNRSPAAGQQYFGLATIDGVTEVMRVAILDLEGKELYSVDLEPMRG
ncbi:alkaline phosphatase [Betaproteobacteria bacterium GR16-43]|nr:alkaline phosphatase [Betaproteobacteria bacterium GR16-43]